MKIELNFLKSDSTFTKMIFFKKVYKKIPFLPILFSIFLILYVYRINIDQLKFSYLLFPFILSALISILIYLGLLKIIKNRSKASLITSIFIILFFSFGHLYNIRPYIAIGEFRITSYFLFIFVWIDILFLFSFFLIRTSLNLRFLINCFNIIAISLIVFQLVPIVNYTCRTLALEKELNSKTIMNESRNFYSSEILNLPDIYYIIFDGYARADILKEIYNYDNSSFIKYLEKKGFYVANQSRSNYSQTYQSMASSLNFMYLNHLRSEIGKSSNDRRLLINMIRKCKAYYILKKQGYQFVSIPNFWNVNIDHNDTDLIVKWDGNLNIFYDLVINTTPLGRLLENSVLVNNLRNIYFFIFDYISKI